uniref:Cathepsin propeptide inhibitor domain-containing protein n=1 Tax=Oryza punctata TaxID=4537 RepID=A0A0E0L3Z2_ORYPU
MSLRAIGYLLTRSREVLAMRDPPCAGGILVLAGYPHSSGRPRFGGGEASSTLSPLRVHGPAREGEEEVSVRDAVKEPYLSKEAAIEAGFVDKDGKILWFNYLTYVKHGKTLPDSEAFVKKARDYPEAIKKQEVKVDEVTMKARFQDWMKEYGRSYSTEEEKARRYETFKESAMWADKVNALEPRTISYGHNRHADFTDEEFKCLHSHCSAIDWESYIDELNTMAARGWTYLRDPDATNVNEAVRNVYIFP